MADVWNDTRRDPARNDHTGLGPLERPANLRRGRLGVSQVGLALPGRTKLLRRVKPESTSKRSVTSLSAGWTNETSIASAASPDL